MGVFSTDDRELLRAAVDHLARPISLNDNKEVCFARVAARAGISERLVKALWWREDVNVSAEKLQRVLEAALSHDAGLPHEISDFRSLIAANRAARSSNAARLARMDLEDAPSFVDLAFS